LKKLPKNNSQKTKKSQISIYEISKLSEVLDFDELAIESYL
jgi:hypothetical protein